MKNYIINIFHLRKTAYKLTIKKTFIVGFLRKDPDFEIKIHLCNI